MLLAATGECRVRSGSNVESCDLVVIILDGLRFGHGTLIPVGRRRRQARWREPGLAVR